MQLFTYYYKHFKEIIYEVKPAEVVAKPNSLLCNNSVASYSCNYVNEILLLYSLGNAVKVVLALVRM